MTLSGLSRRERQIMDIIFKLGEASVAQVQEQMKDAPGYSSIRKIIAILEEKGHLRHRRQGKKYIFQPAERPEKARDKALGNLVNTFFGGSAFDTVATLINKEDLNKSQIQKLKAMIEEAEKESEEGQ